MSRIHDLDGYVTGELPDTEADALEEALFDAPDDPDLRFVDRLARHGAHLVEHGTFDMGITSAQLALLIDAGHTVQIIEAGMPSDTEHTITIDKTSELILTKLALGRTDIDRVDVEIELLDHGVTKTIKDALVDQTEGVIYGLCERALAEIAFGAGRTRTRVRRRDGSREVLATWHLVGQMAP